jgi:uncharacterized delta-60 repeat protein
MDFNEIITFEGGINTDDTPQGVPKGDYRDFSYCRLGYNSGNAFAVETSSGTVEITNEDIYPEDKVLGAAQWLKENAIVYFIYKDTGIHEIWVYYISTQTHLLVLQDAVLNFSAEWPIFHANVIDDILKWTDGRWNPDMYDDAGTRLFNPPYQINLRKAIDGFYTIIDLQTIDAIKWPMEPPIVSYFTDTTRNDNKLRGKLFKFIVQPIYENGEIGVWSMYSNLSLPDQSELVSGTNWVFLNNDNVIRIQFDTGPKVIRGFNLAVQQYDKESFGTVPPFGVFLQLDKIQDNIGDNAFHTINFYGGVATSGATDVFKNYDRLPITADCQEYLPTNQLTYTNFREGYDKPSGVPFTLNVQMGYSVREIPWKSVNFSELFYVFIGEPSFGGEDSFVFRYLGNAYANVDTEFIFQANDVFQIVTWIDPLSSQNPYNNQRLFYSLSQQEIDEALALPGTFFDKNAYIMRIIGDSFLTQWKVWGYFEAPATVVSYPNFPTDGIQYVARRRVGFNSITRTADFQGTGSNTNIIVGGDFYAVSNVYSNSICRIFGPSQASASQVDDLFDVGTGFDGTVLAIKVQADNYIVVGGNFTEFDGVSRSRITRLGPDGWLDTGFSVGTGFNGDVYSIKIQPDGKILVGGEFTSYNGSPVNLIARLNTDGTLDPGFTSPVTSVTPTISSVLVIDLQSTGKIIIGGRSIGIPSAVSTNLAGLNTDGTYDVTFAGNPNGDVLTIAIGTSDVVFIGGMFTQCNLTPRSKIAKLSASGGLDLIFNPGTGFDNTVYSLVVRNFDLDVCGDFTTYKGLARKQLVRIDYSTADFIVEVDSYFDEGNPIYLLTRTFSGGPTLFALGNFLYTAPVAPSGANVTVNRMASFVQTLAGGPLTYQGTYWGSQTFIGNLPRNNDWSIRYINYQRTTNATPSLKAGATHEFGIVYGDRAYRDSTVYTLDSMNVFVPWFYDIANSGALTDKRNPFAITPNITINHVPPVWATKYWIVAKPATEILSFGQYVTNRNDATFTLQSSVVLDSNNSRYKVYIDNYYVRQNKGANVRHEIKVGDKLRFKRSNWYYLDYLPYIELDIVGVEVEASANNRTVVYTNLFDSDIISLGDDFTASATQLFGQEIEIYTPRPSVDDTGNIFVSSWKDITEAIQIKEPHTEDRSHGSPVQYYIQWSSEVFGGNYFFMSGDQSQLAGTSWPNSTTHYADGTIDQEATSVNVATYDSLQNVTKIELSSVGADPTIAYITLNGQDQVVSALTSTTPAYYSIDYGDVYLRQRNSYSGVAGARSVLFYYMEDFNYSDYFPSSVYNDGRLRIEDQNAKMIDRKASSIHSDTFILGTQVNGLSSFALDNQNIEDMNPLYGEIVRTYMSGREGKTLKCLQPKRENSIYIQYYPNEVGSDSTVRVSNKTFASWFDYKSLFGCTDAGATALLPNGSVMYFDNNSGVFIYSGGNGQMVASEIDPDTGKDYKFRTKTKELAKAYNESANPIVRTYVNETVGEVGFAFSFDDEQTYDHVVFDYVNMRWRSTYDYNFRQFCNLGQTLVGWGKDNQLYLHNQDGEWTFHGDPFIQKVTFVSNENPLLLKRYQDITLISDDKFAIEASSEPNRSYPLGMKTTMTENLLGMYEGYGKTNYRKNLYDPKFFVVGNESETNSNTWTLNGNQTGLDGEMITIVQDDKNIYTGIIDNPVYNSGPNTTDVELVGLQPGTTGVEGTWYLSERVLLNGEDVRANALTHTLSYDPTTPGASGEGSVLFSVGIKGVLS